MDVLLYIYTIVNIIKKSLLKMDSLIYYRLIWTPALFFDSCTAALKLADW